MEDTTDSSIWIKFFTDAGISSKSARAYAQTFSDNHIQENMVKDLTNDYLQQLGITLVGHIIAILRHAKTVRLKPHEVKRVEKVKPILMARICSEDEEEDAPQVNKTGSGKSTAVNRIVDHYTRNSGTNTVNRSPKHEKLISRGTSNKEKKSQIVRSIKRKLEADSSDEMEDEEQLSPLQHMPVSVVKTPTVSSTDTTIVAKKPRRVLPEHEGGYSIKMPEGNTPRSREILEKLRAMKEQRAKTVFDRLGTDCSVTSTTQPEKDTAFNVTLEHNTFKRKKLSNRNGVFNRLGNRIEKTSVPNIVEPQPLPYNGILKKKVNNIDKIVVNKQKTLTSTMTMRADEPSRSVKERAVLKTKFGAKTYVAPKQSISTVSPGTEGILGKSQFKSALKKTSVKSRLGSPSLNADSSDFEKRFRRSS